MCLCLGHTYFACTLNKQEADNTTNSHQMEHVKQYTFLLPVCERSTTAEKATTPESATFVRSKTWGRCSLGHLYNTPDSNAHSSLTLLRLSSCAHSARNVSNCKSLHWLRSIIDPRGSRNSLASSRETVDQITSNRSSRPRLLVLRQTNETTGGCMESADRNCKRVFLAPHTQICLSILRPTLLPPVFTCRIPASLSVLFSSSTGTNLATRALLLFSLQRTLRHRRHHRQPPIPPTILSLVAASSLQSPLSPFLSRLPTC